MARRGRAFSTISIISERGLFAPAIIVDSDVVLLTLTPSGVETQVQFALPSIDIIKQAPNRASTY